MLCWRGVGVFLFGFSNVLGLESLGSAGHVEGHRISFGQSPKSIHLDGRVVHKHVATRRSLNESISLGIIEPLYFPNFLFHGNLTP